MFLAVVIAVILQGKAEALQPLDVAHGQGWVIQYLVAHHAGSQIPVPMGAQGGQVTAGTVAGHGDAPFIDPQLVGMDIYMRQHGPGVLGPGGPWVFGRQTVLRVHHQRVRLLGQKAAERLHNGPATVLPAAAVEIDDTGARPGCRGGRAAQCRGDGAFRGGQPVFPLFQRCRGDLSALGAMGLLQGAHAGDIPGADSRDFFIGPAAGRLDLCQQLVAQKADAAAG